MEAFYLIVKKYTRKVWDRASIVYRNSGATRYIYKAPIFVGHIPVKNERLISVAEDKLRE